MSVRRCQQEVDAREFAEWLAYDGIEPFGPQRADFQAGIVASTMANCWRGKGQRALKPSDFMPDYSGKTERQSRDQVRSSIQQWAMTQQVTDKPNGSNR